MNSIYQKTEDILVVYIFNYRRKQPLAHTCQGVNVVHSRILCTVLGYKIQDMDCRIEASNVFFMASRCHHFSSGKLF